jgi:UDP-N-acetylglucosamine 2-epimerase
VKVFSVVGNRPQFVKAAPTSVALRERGIDEVVLHTGQHYDPELSQVFFDELGLETPRYSLDLQTPDAEQMRAAIAAPLAQERPDWVLVYGDTNSTLAGALAARRRRLRTSRRGCGAATSRCPRSATGSRSTASRTCC